MKTTVVKINKVNGKRPEFDEYMGRPIRYPWAKGTIFEKGSIWANPYGRDEPLSSYEGYIRNRIDIEPKKYDLRKLRGKRLGCWCVTTDKIEPTVCHVQIIMKLIREVSDE